MILHPNQHTTQNQRRSRGRARNKEKREQASTSSHSIFQCQIVVKQNDTTRVACKILQKLSPKQFDLCDRGVPDRASTGIDLEGFVTSRFHRDKGK